MPDIVVTFFILGLLAGLLRSDLKVPKAAYDTLSLLLMLTIGLKGGLALFGNLSPGLFAELLVIASVGAAIPFLLIPLLQHLIGLSKANACSVAAHYGSVSAGTFAVGLSYVENLGLDYSPQVTLYLVMLELPAIIVGLAMHRRLSSDAQKPSDTNGLWHETLTNRGVVLLTGGVLIGWMYGPEMGASVTDLFLGAFSGVLAIFLLEMGLTAADTLRPFPKNAGRALAFAVIAPPVLGTVGIGVSMLLGLSLGTTIILAAMIASASYIAAPAAIRVAIPEADIGLAMLLSLGLTFPFNVIAGIPLYHSIATALL